MYLRPPKELIAPVWCKISAEHRVPSLFLADFRSLVRAALDRVECRFYRTSGGDVPSQLDDSLPSPVPTLRTRAGRMADASPVPAIEYLREENRVLLSRPPKARLRFTEGERIRLDVRGVPFVYWAKHCTAFAVQ